MDANGLVAVIIVNWNSYHHTLNAYRSLLNSDYNEWCLIVVDNASSDQSRLQIKQAAPDINLIESSHNTGFSGGCNIGIASAKTMGAKFIFLLNSDATVKCDTLSRLVNTYRNISSRSILGPTVRFAPSGTIQFTGSVSSSLSGRPKWYDPETTIRSTAQELIESDIIFGAALFCPASAFDEIGLLDERFFLNYEETDWCYRARSLGYQCYVLKSADVYHLGSASIGGSSSPLQTYFITRNRLLFSKKHNSFGQRIFTYYELGRNTLSTFLKSLRYRGMGARLIRMSLIASLIGFLDYIMSRFGDSPALIRALQDEYKSHKSSHKSDLSI